MAKTKPIEELVERVERLLVRYAELQRTNELLSDQIEELTTERDQLRLEMGAGYTTTALAIRILTCDPALSDAKFLRTGLLFARKVFQAARRLLTPTAPTTPTSDQGADAFFDDSP